MILTGEKTLKCYERRRIMRMNNKQSECSQWRLGSASASPGEISVVSEPREGREKQSDIAAARS